MFNCRQGVRSVLVYVYCLILCVHCEGQMIEGDQCFDKKGIRGQCIALTNCDHALNLIETGISPAFCDPGSEDNFNALVCCQNANAGSQNLRERPSLQKCKEYYPELLEKGFVYFAAVGGTRALAKVYKHMALIGYGDKDDISWLCGGSLISDKFVLTAAHCIFTRNGEPEWVRLGELDTANDTDDADPQDFKISRAIAHPAYQIESVYNDIGLLELDQRLNFSEYIRPACLYQSNDVLSNFTFAVATGWGHTSFGGQPSSHLIEVNLKLVNHTWCNRFFRGLPKKQLSVGISEHTQMCAGGNDGRDTCQGDSGGPLQVRNMYSKPLRTVFDIIGITSFGTACGIANTPGIYTKVSFYLDWIERIVWP